MPTGVRLVVPAQACAHDLVSFLLRRHVDARVNRKSGLRHARRVLIFQILADIFDRIIKLRRQRLRRLVIGRVSKLNWFRLGCVDLSLRREACFGNLIEHQVATLFSFRGVRRRRVFAGCFRNSRE